MKPNLIKHIRQLCKEIRTKGTEVERRSSLTYMERKSRLRAQQERHAMSQDIAAERKAQMNADRERRALARALRPQDKVSSLKYRIHFLLVGLFVIPYCILASA